MFLDYQYETRNLVARHSIPNQNLAFVLLFADLTRGLDKNLWLLKVVIECISISESLGYLIERIRSQSSPEARWVG
jgi:hypothetical protein